MNGTGEASGPASNEGELTAAGRRFAVVVSRYNETVTGRMLHGALETLSRAGAESDQISVAWVPGAYELPLAADRLAASGRYGGVICLGAVIRGETTHDQHINRAVSLELMQSSVRHGVPIAFGVLTCNSLEQALARAGGPVGNKGSEAAEAVLKMADLLPKLDR
ncbi:MAG: 6,7-dimethyl-8-ribityllumazine synthase [Planctomycetales bacterium]|nr:6,7-dimethyl-8-ribityllumazine synthase [Planctomycetales bacterium]